VILISLLGVLVLRHTGGDAVTRQRTTAGRSELRGIGAGTALGGILMVIPGFITGVLGLLMVMPTTRVWLAGTTLRHFTQQHRAPPPGTIDLTPEE
jgi:UPF0716 protein FxsA